MDGVTFRGDERRKGSDELERSVCTLKEKKGPPRRNSPSLPGLGSQSSCVQVRDGWPGEREVHRTCLPRAVCRGDGQPELKHSLRSLVEC